jgi:hypothetical protein
MLNIVPARKNQPMYRLHLLGLDLSLLNYSGNPYTDTLPSLVSLLGGIIVQMQSYGTILAAVNASGSYARGVLDTAGVPCVVVITRIDA